MAEIRMLRWISDVTRMDRIRIEIVRRTTRVGETSKKVHERRLKWYGHVMRRDEEYVRKKVMRMDLEGRRRKGRPKQRWMDSVNVHLRDKGLSGEVMQNRFWYIHIWSETLTHIKVRKDAVEEEVVSSAAVM